jgi:hypothetical protein
MPHCIPILIATSNNNSKGNLITLHNPAAIICSVKFKTKTSAFCSDGFHTILKINSIISPYNIRLVVQTESRLGHCEVRTELVHVTEIQFRLHFLNTDFHYNRS